MKRVFSLCALMLLAICAPAAAKGSKPDAPPPGIAPTTATLSQILKAYDTATGTLPKGPRDTRVSQWSFSREGLRGTETLVRSGADYVAHFAAGPLSRAYGRFLGNGWHQDENGVVSPSQSEDFTSFEMLLLTREFDAASDPKNDVKVLGEVASPSPAYVLEVDETGDRHPWWIFYDKASGLIDKAERVTGDRRIDITYGDYRKTNGLTQPWHIHFTDGDPLLDDDFTQQSLQAGIAVDPKQFAIPRSSTAFATYTKRITLPGHIAWNIFDIPTVIVRFTVNGRGLDFALSSDAPESYIDYDVAQELNLPAYGQKVRDSKHNLVPFDTVLADAQIGGMTLHNFAVRAIPFHYHPDQSTKIVGLLGYDMLSSGVFKIDYVNGTLDVMEPKYFDRPDPVPAAWIIPLQFDSGRPFFSGSIADHETKNFIVDNNFWFTFLLGSYTDLYPDTVKDLDSARHVHTTIPFADNKSYGRDVDVWAANVPDIHFGPAHFINFKLFASNMPLDVGGHDIDGIAGGDMLRYYDVFFDFPHQRFLLKPNTYFFQRFKVQVEK